MYGNTEMHGGLAPRQNAYSCSLCVACFFVRGETDAKQEYDIIN